MIIWRNFGIKFMKSLKFSDQRVINLYKTIYSKKYGKILDPLTSGKSSINQKLTYSTIKQDLKEKLLKILYLSDNSQKIPTNLTES